MEDETFESILDDWLTAKQKLKEVQDLERMLRNRLIRGAFPEPKEGTNTLELADGRVIKYTHKLDRKVDDGDALLAAMREAGVNDVEPFVRTRYDLKMSAYKALQPTSTLRQAIDRHITTKPGAGTFEVV